MKRAAVRPALSPLQLSSRISSSTLASMAFFHDSCEAPGVSMASSVVALLLPILVTIRPLRSRIWPTQHKFSVGSNDFGAERGR